MLRISLTSFLIYLSSKLPQKSHPRNVAPPQRFFFRSRKPMGQDNAKPNELRNQVAANVKLAKAKFKEAREAKERERLHHLAQEKKERKAAAKANAEALSNQVEQNEKLRDEIIKAGNTILTNSGNSKCGF